jgi:hypothetical protein
MSRVEVAQEVTDDFDRILAHLAQRNVRNASARIGEITTPSMCWRPIRSLVGQRLATSAN